MKLFEFDLFEKVLFGLILAMFCCMIWVIHNDAVRYNTCTSKGGILINTPRGITCAKLDVIK